MTKKVDAERLADELLMAFGKELGEARADFCEALLDPDKLDPPMFLDDDDDWDLPPAAKEFDPDDWKVVPVKPMGTGGFRRRARRMFVLAAVVVLVMGMAMIGAEGVKLKESTVHMKADTGDSLKLTDIEKTKFDVEDFVVTYVPEGYELVEDVCVGEVMRSIRYSNGESLEVWIHISKTDNFSANVDQGSAERTEVLVNDNQAYLFDDGATRLIVWQMGDCTIDITADISEEELVMIARQIFIK